MSGRNEIALNTYIHTYHGTIIFLMLLLSKCNHSDWRDLELKTVKCMHAYACLFLMKTSTPQTCKSNAVKKISVLVLPWSA